MAGKWRWTLRGTELNQTFFGRDRPLEETGVIEAENAGEAITLFDELEGWSTVDLDQAVTLEVTPEPLGDDSTPDTTSRGND